MSKARGGRAIRGAVGSGGAAAAGGRGAPKPKGPPRFPRKLTRDVLQFFTGGMKFSPDALNEVENM